MLLEHISFERLAPDAGQMRGVRRSRPPLAEIEPSLGPGQLLYARGTIDRWSDQR
jgi:hypothetical protein